MLLVLAGGSAGLAHAHLEVISNADAPRVFFGERKVISVTLHNPSAQEFNAEIRTRIYQTSSATAVPVSEAAWKTLRVLPHQAVLETVSLNFPAVKAETRYIVQWLDDTNVIGKTEVLVYPTNLLAELKPLLDGETVGVLDPNDKLKPLLRQNGVTFTDLGQTALENFSGRLAILGPFRSKAQLPEDVAKRTKAMAKNGVAIVWLQPPPGPREKLQPSYYSVAAGTNTIVVAQSSLVVDLPELPQSQLHLLRLCRLALHPEPPALPESNPQP